MSTTTVPARHRTRQTPRTARSGGKLIFAAVFTLIVMTHPAIATLVAQVVVGLVCSAALTLAVYVAGCALKKWSPPARLAVGPIYVEFL